MNNFWSDNVQGVMTLYLGRKLRFHDPFSEQYGSGTARIDGEKRFFRCIDRVCTYRPDS